MGSGYQTKRGKTRHINPALLAVEPEFVTLSGQACGLCTIKGLKPGNPNWQNQVRESREK